MKNYLDYDATGLAKLVSQGDVTPLELVDEAIARTESTNPQLNAVVWNDFEKARHKAAGDLPDGPFRGVPYLIKDLSLEAGARVTFGSVFFRDFVSDTSSIAVSRMMKAGLISIGRTNAPEFGLLPITEPVLHGATNNPWSLGHSPGGSSGGAAAAVAGGIVPMAHANDGGGSIRIPASSCGLFGLKPSRGVVPSFPATASDYLTAALCVSRSVRDTARLLDAISGALPGATYVAPPRAEPLASTMERDPPPLRIALTTCDMRGTPADSECTRAVTEAGELLESLGHTVTEDAPKLATEGVIDAFRILWAMGAAGAFQLVLDEVNMKRGGRMVRKALGDDRMMRLVAALDKRKSGLAAFEPFTWDLVKYGRRFLAQDLTAAYTVLQQATFDLSAFTKNYDIMMSPVLATAPPALGWVDQTAGIKSMWRQLEGFAPYTPIANFSGRPAMTVPLHWTAEKLPVGVHFTGELNREDVLLQLARQLEQAKPWFKKLSPIASGQTVKEAG